MYAVKVQVGVGTGVAAIEGVLTALRLQTFLLDDAWAVPTIRTVSNDNYIGKRDQIRVGFRLDLASLVVDAVPPWTETATKTETSEQCTFSMCNRITLLRFGSRVEQQATVRSTLRGEGAQTSLSADLLGQRATCLSFQCQTGPDPCRPGVRRAGEDARNTFYQNEPIRLPTHVPMRRNCSLADRLTT